MNEQRLIDLEIKYSHQTMELEKLQNAVLENTRTIERLEKTITILSQRLEAFTATKVGPANERPPHY